MIEDISNNGYEVVYMFLLFATCGKSGKSFKMGVSQQEIMGMLRNYHLEYSDRIQI